MTHVPKVWPRVFGYDRFPRGIPFVFDIGNLASSFGTASWQRKKVNGIQSTRDDRMFLEEIGKEIGTVASSPTRSSMFSETVMSRMLA